MVFLFCGGGGGKRNLKGGLRSEAGERSSAARIVNS